MSIAKAPYQIFEYLVDRLKAYGSNLKFMLLNPPDPPGRTIF